MQVFIKATTGSDGWQIGLPITQVLLLLQVWCLNLLPFLRSCLYKFSFRRQDNTRSEVNFTKILDVSLHIYSPHNIFKNHFKYFIFERYLWKSLPTKLRSFCPKTGSWRFFSSGTYIFRKCKTDEIMWRKFWFKKEKLKNSIFQITSCGYRKWRMIILNHMGSLTTQGLLLLQRCLNLLPFRGSHSDKIFPESDKSDDRKWNFKKKIKKS